MSPWHSLGDKFSAAGELMAAKHFPLLLTSPVSPLQPKHHGLLAALPGLFHGVPEAAGVKSQVKSMSALLQSRNMSLASSSLSCSCIRPWDATSLAALFLKQSWLGSISPWAW